MDKNNKNEEPAVDPYRGVTKKAPPRKTKIIPTEQNEPAAVDPYRGVAKDQKKLDTNPRANIGRPDACADPYRGVTKPIAPGPRDPAVNPYTAVPKGTLSPSNQPISRDTAANRPIEAIISGPGLGSADRRADREEYKERVKEATAGAFVNAEEAFGLDETEKDPIHGQERSFGEEVADYIGRLYGSAKNILGMGAEKTAEATGYVKESAATHKELAKEEGQEAKVIYEKNKEIENRGTTPTAAESKESTKQAFKEEGKQIKGIVVRPFKRYAADEPPEDELSRSRTPENVVQKN